LLAPKGGPSRRRSAKPRTTVSSDDDDDIEEPLAVSTRRVPSSSKGKAKATPDARRKRQLRESENAIRTAALQLLMQAEALRLLREAEYGS